MCKLSYSIISQNFTFWQNMFSIIQCRLKSYTEKELPVVQSGVRKGQEMGDIIADALGN